MNRYTENVKRGAELLDETRPGWRTTIDLATLTMSSGCLCILGQLYEHYSRGVHALWGIDVEAYDYHEWVTSSGFQTSVAHGFTIIYTDDEEEDNASWQALEEAWIAELGGNHEPLH